MDNKDFLILTKGRAVCLVLDTAIGLLNESFEIAKNNVRMEYNVEAKVRYSQGRIRCDKTYRYKLCRGASSVHEPILIGMSDDNIKFIVKEIKITDSFQVPAYAKVTFNPASEQSYITFGLSF